MRKSWDQLNQDTQYKEMDVNSYIRTDKCQSLKTGHTPEIASLICRTEALQSAG